MLTNQKPVIEKYLDPITKPLSNASPNVLTLLGSIPSILFFVFIINKWYILALIALVGTAFDMIDGMVARKYNKVTKFGGFLDSTFDRISDFLLITSFAFAGLVRWEIAAPVLFSSFLISYIRSRSEAANPNASFAVGLMERTERLIMIGMALLMYMLFPNIIIKSLNIAEVIFVVLLTLSFYTVVQRIIHAYKKL